jgi:hypothetical protein
VNTEVPPPEDFPAQWRGLVDDAAVFPPGNASFDDALAAFTTRQQEWCAPFVGSFVVRDTDLGAVPGQVPVSVVLSTGAGAVEGVVRQAAKRGLQLAGLELVLNDRDDLAGNARRVDAALRAAEIDVPVFVEIPGPVTAAWLAAADEVAACDHRLKLRLGHVDHDHLPGSGTVAAWIDAALDRETRFKATAGLHRAVRHDPEGGGTHGFLNVMAATQALWDGGSAAEATEALEQRDGAVLAATDLSAARRWFTSFGSCSVTDPLDDLIGLGLLEAPR